MNDRWSRQVAMGIFGVWVAIMLTHLINGDVSAAESIAYGMTVVAVVHLLVRGL